jgi:hypothetical protein
MAPCFDTPDEQNAERIAGREVRRTDAVELLGGVRRAKDGDAVCNFRVCSDDLAPYV